jgi:hypothetical protein
MSGKESNCLRSVYNTIGIKPEHEAKFNLIVMIVAVMVLLYIFNKQIRQIICGPNGLVDFPLSTNSQIFDKARAIFSETSSPFVTSQLR